MGVPDAPGMVPRDGFKTVRRSSRLFFYAPSARVGAAIEHACTKLRTGGAKVYGISAETLLATYLDAVGQEPRRAA